MRAKSIKRGLLWFLGVLAAIGFWRRWARRGHAPDVAKGAPILSAVATGLVAAWRVAASEHRLLRQRSPAPAAGWRGGESGSLVLRPSALPTAQGSSAFVPPAPTAAPGHDQPTDIANVRQAAAEPAVLARGWGYVRELLRRFNRDQCPVFAAALSFFGLVSIVPVLLLAIAALGYLMHDPHQARDYILRAVQQLLPGKAARDAAAQLMAQIQFENQVDTLLKSRGTAGVIGAVTLIWAALQIFVSSIPAMNAAWEVTEHRGWLHVRLIALGLLFGAGALFLLSLLPSSGPDFVRRLHIPWLGLPEQVPRQVDWLFTLLAVTINAAMFALIYRYLPAAEVKWREAAVGGLSMGILWELAKQGFSLYLATLGAKNAMYGALGGIMILITWIYYTSMLLLLGAEVAKLYKDVCESRVG